MAEWKLDTNARIEVWVEAKNDEEAFELAHSKLREITEGQGVDITTDGGDLTCKEKDLIEDENIKQEQPA